ncbi:MAG TPA: transcriptional repressor LexA [Sediminispirochaeta sp.]|nr:transcriptional repressor LexA [Sediminispirochaeta sp.]
MKQLTQRQKQVLDFIGRFVDSHGYPPSMREIASEFEISVKAAFDHVRALEKKEKIRCDFNRSRALELVSPPDEEKEELIEVPLLGNVAAGKPLFAEENFERILRLPSSVLSTGKFFALNVRGDSMIDAGILDGDTAIFAQKNTAENGDIVVARVNDEAVTLKKYFREKNRIKLKAENPIYPPIYSQHVHILGKLVYIFRAYD